ncbi:MAG: hypothetical protein CFE62_003035 [Candidatus Aquirickettsiella gammari]|uniref:Uncharacterized protein n=1 Tax=Candidatus Aquirickettsiella gammari TaxID=2016198 RepID=A0A370CIK1_9COXI|nr:MAG: hypothetical protein CFE62_003035 [Candidatus Aquirickettsiella gammari]
MLNLLSSLFTESKVNLTDEQIQERKYALELIQKDLAQKFSDLIDDEKRFEKFSQALKEKLSDTEKAIYGDGLDPATVAEMNRQIKEGFKEKYELALEESIEKLKKNIDAQEIIKSAQTSLLEKLKQKKITLVAELIASLEANRQYFPSEDKPHLEKCLNEHLDEISQKLIATLAEIKPETIQVRLQLDNDNSASAEISGHITAIGNRKLNQLKIAPLAPAYKINIDDLSKRIKNSLANLKPGEKINIALSVPPDRGDSLKRITEQGLQYRSPLVALLLLIFIQLKMIKKDDETRVFEAIKKLAVNDGIAIDPNDIQFEVSKLDNNGKKQILAKKLSPYFTLQLERIRQQLDGRLKKEKWSSGSNKKSSISEQSDSDYDSGTGEDEDDDNGSGLANTSPRLSA